MKKNSIVYFIFLILIISCKDKPIEMKKESQKVNNHRKISKKNIAKLLATTNLAVPDVENIEYPDDDPPSKELVILGKQLFHDPILSKSKKMSCAKCHDQDKGLSDGLSKSIGDKGNKTPRSTPHIYNIAWSKKLLWDGRSDDLASMSLIPIKGGVVMNLPLDEMNRRLNDNSFYRKSFRKLFKEGITSKNVGKALAAFQRSIISQNTDFDKYLKGDHKALTEEQLYGLKLFIGKGNCIKCHDGPNFTDGGFHNIGIRSSDIGRGKFDTPSIFNHAFKTPGLRNVTFSAPYMHDGSMSTLKEVMDFYNRGGDRKEGIDSSIKPLNLSEKEIQQIISFLKTLEEKIDILKIESPVPQVLKEKKVNVNIVKGTFKFEKHPPIAGLIYFSEDVGLIKKLVVDQKGTEFLKKIDVTSPNSSEISFKNSAHISHNVYANDKKLDVKFDLGLAPPNSLFHKKQPISWETGKILKIGCKIHPNMKIYVASIKSRFYKLFEFDNTIKKIEFEIYSPEDENLTEITVWLPKYDEVKVNINRGETKIIRLMKKKKLKGTLVLKRI